MSDTMVNWLSHSIGMILVVAFSLPSFALIWMAKKVAKHKELKIEEVQSVALSLEGNQTKYADIQQSEILSSFNEDIFIQKASAADITRGKHILIETSTEDIAIFPKDGIDLYVERINRKSRKVNVYWARSSELAGLLAR
ncbi:YfmQ family protein [Brevibacillus sp. SYSU BS000544]|uniref:YfmQ family protein n=1 Tax=Brevibacillus sp. SYSU BS000544 TaxID=3416443 RepID=UPI003CE448A6